MNLLPRDIRFAKPAACIAWLMVACGCFLVLFSALMLVSPASAQPPKSLPSGPFPQDGPAGKAIFDEKCISCHTIGGGKLVGPDLKDVTQRRDLQWIKNFLLDPPKMLASDPVAQQLLQENNNVTMPNLHLTAAQVDQLVAFLSSPGLAPAAPAAAAPSGLGNPLAGKKLFTGELALANGGPACMACHTAGGAGSLGGGALGPDLTHAVQRLGEPGLNAALKTIAFPTMIGPFLNHPLAPNELADLVAFLKDVDQRQPPVTAVNPGALSGNAILVFSIALVISGFLFGLLLFYWVRIKKTISLRLPVRKVSSTTGHLTRRSL